MDLSSLLNSTIGQTVVKNVAGQLNLGESEADSAIGQAIPMLLSGMGKNAQTSDGAESLNKALESKHDGSILDNIGDLLANNSAGLQKEGNGILGHVFGSNVGNIQNSLSQKTGLGVEQAGSLLSTLAPIVMGFLGKEKRNNNIDASGIGGLLGGLMGGSSKSGIFGMVEGFLDKDGDGSAVDDVLGMFGK